ncbi:hypothetical protein HYPSUDRAFT_45128 [Hypholoma sublateritium FD-334 SS-4]|uniref:Uncharacterized protein n=1 Tax=Hypholoma sublateritium (strain FD-334 SS-4) TaxID=945553 RepID=A0A0D2NP68_HYPSF|nr:hypothetical protein HYPSUDRAFT_45128 [Hypholoma sublateritium FD-334 SS-4]
MDCFFLPIVCGCSTKISPEGDQTPRICPRCHNAAVTSTKSKEYFELCFVPLVPMSTQHLWRCAICQWAVPIQPGWEPQLVTNVPTQPGGYYPAQPGMQPNFVPQGYQGAPAYQGQQPGQYAVQYQGQQPVQQQGQYPPK